MSSTKGRWLKTSTNPRFLFWSVFSRSLRKPTKDRRDSLRKNMLASRGFWKNGGKSHAHVWKRFSWFSSWCSRVVGWLFPSPSQAWRSFWLQCLSPPQPWAAQRWPIRNCTLWRGWIWPLIASASISSKRWTHGFFSFKVSRFFVGFLERIWGSKLWTHEHLQIPFPKETQTVMFVLKISWSISTSDPYVGLTRW